VTGIESIGEVQKDGGDEAEYLFCKSQSSLWLN